MSVIIAVTTSYAHVSPPPQTPAAAPSFPTRHTNSHSAWTVCDSHVLSGTAGYANPTLLLPNTDNSVDLVPDNIATRPSTALHKFGLVTQDFFIQDTVVHISTIAEHDGFRYAFVQVTGGFAQVLLSCVILSTISFACRRHGMIVVVTGMVGIDKKRYLEEVVAFCKKKGKDVRLFNVGDMMYAEDPAIPTGRILDLSLKHLKSLRRSIIRDIIAKKDCAENVIINTHATFRWQHGLFPAFDFDLSREIAADMYVCIVDGIDTVHQRLNREHQSSHTLKDLLVWREEEILGTRLMCDGVDKPAPMYVLGRGIETTTVSTLYSLMFEPTRRKVYLSFPITHVVDLPDVQKEINDFRTRMKDNLICFDPGDVEESGLIWQAHAAAQQGQLSIDVTTLGEKVHYDIREITGVEPDINRQIYARDFMLIDQADMIVSYMPGDRNGKAIISSGVERELQHAHENGKEAYVIWTGKNEPSVFVTQTAKVFRSSDEAIKFFKKKKYFPGQ